MPADELAKFRAIYPRLLKTVSRCRRRASLCSPALTPLQVLQAATLDFAKVMKPTTAYGAVEPGKIADLVLLDGDPTKDIAALDETLAKAVALRERN